MHDTVKSIKNLLRFSDIKIDNAFFLLHYKATMVILVVFSLLVTKKHYFGDPIDCIVEAINSKTIDMYCWIHSTYTIPELTGGIVGEEVAHPGVSNHHDAMLRQGVANTAGAGGANVEADAAANQYTIRQHTYYQWVVMFLALQAFMFYLPRFMWKSWEAGRLQRLVGDVHSPLGDPDLRQRQLDVAVNYFVRYFHYHNIYAYQFFVCELLNFINIIGQIYFTDRFLDHGFLDYGPRVTKYARLDGIGGYDPKDEVFPKVAKCTFHKFGPSGTIMRHDAICVLPLNILYEKIFAFLWFWFLLVAVLSGIGLIYRFATFTPTIRNYLLRARSRFAAKDKLDAISRKCYIGDWFMLYLIAKNMDPFVYKEFILNVSQRLVEKEHAS